MREKEQGFKCLEQNLMDMVAESQIKLGYAHVPLQLYYPLTSLNHTLKTAYDTDDMQKCLNQFCSYVEERLGKVICTHKGERFAILIPAEGNQYVYEHVEVSEFLKELVLQSSHHGFSKEAAKALFGKYSKEVGYKEMDHEDFDFLLYFKDARPDDYLYCFHEEGEHLIYHRYSRGDYEDFGFKK